MCRHPAADELPIFAGDVDNSLDRSNEFRMLQVAWMAECDGEVVWPQDQGIKTDNCGNLLHFVESRRILDLHCDEQLPIRELHPICSTFPAVICCPPWSEASVPVG